MNTTRIALAASLLPLALAACSGTSPDVPDTGSGDVACTQEAKLCPDGSYVGRQGPNCEFTACPVTSSTTQRIATDGALSIVYSSAFSLAHKPEEISKQSYIPPCEQGFVFCLYYTGKDYDGTNFDGAGLGVVKRSDIDTESECLDTPPEGYTDVTPISRRETEYSVSAFPRLGDAAAGHYSHDEFYRLYTQSTCYEFLGRIGQSQYGNYEEGTIEEFAADQETTLRAQLRALMQSVTIDDVGDIDFPSPPATVIGDE